MKRRFICYFYCNGLAHFSLGFHICFEQPNIEIHVPLGFFRIGWTKDPEGFCLGDQLGYKLLYRSWGIQ